jgi:hypothetical protein
VRSADVQTVPVPPDLWAVRKRRRRWWAIAIAALLLALIVVPQTWQPAPSAVGSVPSRIRVPMPLQPNLVDAPNGPASVIVTGPGGFGANGLSFDDRAIVVGRDGLYRYVRDVNSVDAGEDLLLSTDGRYVAGGADLEGVDSVRSAPDWESTAAVMDLTTGKVRTYHEGAPVAWSPDGRLLVHGLSGLQLLTLRSGEVLPLGVGGVPVAFSPDGRQLALQQSTALSVLDVDTRTVRTVAKLGAAQTLAGPGAWRADGRLAIWNDADCGPTCPAGYHEFRLSFVDIGSGVVTDGRFDAFEAVSAKLLGWQTDGDAVVVLGMMSPLAGNALVRPPQVLSLHPGSGRTSLITVVADADRIDVARNLLDHFGGDPRSGWAMFLDVFRVRLVQAMPWLGAVAILVAIVVTYRRVRARRATGADASFTR